MASIPAEPSMVICTSPLSSAWMSDGFGNWATSASSPYFLNSPWSCANWAVEKAAATCEKATLIGTSSAGGAAVLGAGVAGLAPLGAPLGALLAGALAAPGAWGPPPAVGVVSRAQAAASRTTATRKGSPVRSRVIMMPLLSVGYDSSFGKGMCNGCTIHITSGDTRQLPAQSHLLEEGDDVVFHLVEAADGVEEAGEDALDAGVVQRPDLLGDRLVAAVQVPGAQPHRVPQVHLAAHAAPLVGAVELRAVALGERRVRVGGDVPHEVADRLAVYLALDPGHNLLGV